MFQKHMRQWAAITFAAVGLAWVGAASASVIIIGTRVVYPSDARDVNIRLNNNGELPAMVQAWLDTGSAEAAPETIDVPFRLTPSLFRIDPSKNQSLRLVYAPESADKALPLNKESLFWLNVLEVRPRPVTAKDQNYLQFAVRSRIKLFFRPKDLPGSAATAQESLKWQVKREGNVLRLTATNPVLPGTYRSDVYLNTRWLGRHDITFKAASDTKAPAEACLESRWVGRLSVDPQHISPKARAMLGQNSDV